MHHHHKNHGVGAVAVHIAQQVAKGHDKLQILHIVVGSGYGRGVVKHEQHPGKRQHHEEVECDNACAPVKAHPHAIAADLGRQNVIEYIVSDHQKPIAPVHGIAVPKDRLPDLILGYRILCYFKNVRHNAALTPRQHAFLL